MGLDNYLLTVRKLNNMGRWSTEFMHQRTTVSEHSFFVAQIGQMLGVIEEDKGSKIDWQRLFFKLINHDVVESMTGDIISTTKHKNSQIKSVVDMIERELVEENIIKLLDEPFKKVYREILFEGKDDSLEGKILKYADYIDALIECINEIKLNNYVPFEEKYYFIKEKLEKSELASVEFFLKNILPGLIANCEKLESRGNT